MKTMRRKILFAMTALAALSLPLAHRADAQSFSVIDLGSLNGGQSKAFGLNIAGDVVGESETATASHAVVWQTVS